MASTEAAGLSGGQTTILGLEELAQQIRKLVEENLISPRFADKLTRKVRSELDHVSPSAEEDSELLPLRETLDELSRRVILKKADHLSSAMAYLRDNENA